MNEKELENINNVENNGINQILNKENDQNNTKKVENVENSTDFVSSNIEISNNVVENFEKPIVLEDNPQENKKIEQNSTEKENNNVENSKEPGLVDALNDINKQNNNLSTIIENSQNDKTFENNEKRKKKKKFLLIILIILAILGFGFGGYKVNEFIQNKNEEGKKNEENKDDENKTDDEDITDDNYVPENVDNIEVLNISSDLNKNILNEDSYFNNAVFIGSIFMKNFEIYKNSINSGILGTSKFLFSDNITLEGLLSSVSTESVHPTFNNEKKSLEETIKNLNSKKVFLMFGKEDLEKNGVVQTINNYKKIINKIKSINPGAKIYVISEVYLDKGNETKDLNNSLIRELNYKINNVKSSWGIEYVNYSHALINKKGYLTETFYKDNNFSSQSYNILVNILRNIASSELYQVILNNAYAAVVDCESKLTYETHKNAVDAVKLMKDGTDKIEYNKRLESALKKINSTYSSKLTAVFINGKRYDLGEEVNYKFNVDINTTDVTITANKASEKATVEGLEKYNIVGGSNVIKLTVKNGQNTTVYTLTIDKPSDTKITKVKFNEEEVNLLDLTIKVDKSVEEFELTVEANDPKAMIKGAGKIVLLPGDNNIVFTVNGFEYTLIVLRE